MKIAHLIENLIFVGLEAELKMVKEQLTLLNIQLQFERHRREAHAERNRRLLGKSRSNRALEEHNSALVSLFVLCESWFSFTVLLS
jgi:tuberous sclerosis protein 1